MDLQNNNGLWAIPTNVSNPLLQAFWGITDHKNQETKNQNK